MTSGPNRRGAIVAIAAAAALVVPPYVPQALAFPSRWSVGGVTIRSDTPVSPGIGRILGRADALVATSRLATAPSGRHLFLTNGGWRWRWLAVRSAGPFALTRPLSEAIVVNRSDVGADRVRNGAAVGGERTLSGVIAHERVHTLIRARYGQLAAAALPLWVREGYPDCAARESSLSDRDADALRRAGTASPALAYHDARLRVAEALEANGGSVDRLVAEASR